MKTTPHGVSGEHAGRSRVILAAVDAAERVGELGVHRFRLHPLTGELRGF